MDKSEKVVLLEEEIELDDVELEQLRHVHGQTSEVSSDNQPCNHIDEEQRYIDNLVMNHGYKRVAGKIRAVAYLICVIELAERASYYGITGCLTNFIQRPLPSYSDGTVSYTGSVIDSVHNSPDLLLHQSAGALGLGLQLANFTSQFMTFIAYLSPIFGGYYSDIKIGKLKSIWYGIWVGILGHLLLVIAACPFMLHSGVILKVLSYLITLISLSLIAISAGFIKPNLLPLLMDQYQFDKDIVIDDNREIWDYQMTLNKLSSVFYWCINIGCVFAVLTSYLEQRSGYYQAFLVPGSIYFVILPLLLWSIQGKLYIKDNTIELEQQQQRTNVHLFDQLIPILRQGFDKGWLGRIRLGEYWSYLLQEFPQQRQLIKSLEKTVQVCFIFKYFILFNLNDGSINSIQTNLISETNTFGVPNDLYYNFNPISIIVFIPLYDYIINPICLKKLIKLDLSHKPMIKILIGFTLANIGTLFGIILQLQVYLTNIKINMPLGNQVMSINGNYFGILMFSLQALGEVFCTITAYELSYAYSSKEMKSICMALFLSTNALSAILGEILGLFAIDPLIIVIFLVCFLLGILNSVWFFKEYLK